MNRPERAGELDPAACGGGVGVACKLAPCRWVSLPPFAQNMTTPARRQR